MCGKWSPLYSLITMKLSHTYLQDYLANHYIIEKTLSDLITESCTGVSPANIEILY